ncbi:hypothetical protein LC605_21885 [Nostoc sp. CHAB 5836]|nr:hypothetical protein [Nostoc sp. CHAB 5836]
MKPNTEIHVGFRSAQPNLLAMIRLPGLPRYVEPIARIQGAASLLFEFEKLTVNKR